MLQTVFFLLLSSLKVATMPEHVGAK